MGYSGNYTGYSVNGLDVFYWVLLTAGSIGFPVIVFTICCLKKRYKTQKLVHGLLYSDQQQPKKLLKKGLNGPFVGSEDNLDKKPQKKMMPEIVISPYTFETTNKNFSPSNPMFNNDKNHVRFKDDGQNELPNIMPQDYENDLDASAINSSDLRGLKDAVNYFNKNAVKKTNKSQPSLSNRSVTSGNNQQQQPRYSNNPIQEIIQDNEEPPKEIIYSISSSYAQPGIQANLGTTSDLKKRPVDENIYSQVVPSSLRRSNQPEVDPNEQPLYMNTPYNLAQQQQQQVQYDNQQGSRTSSKSYNQWNDSSL